MPGRHGALLAVLAACGMLTAVLGAASLTAAPSPMDTPLLALATASVQSPPTTPGRTNLFPADKRPNLNATPLLMEPAPSAPPAPTRAVGARGIVIPPTTTPAVPCSDPAGCPDLGVLAQTLADWDLIVADFASQDCSIQEGYALPGPNLLLRFTFTAGNLGPGDLIVGAPGEHPDWFDFDTCHGHSHFREYADYRLWTPSGYEAWEAVRQAHPEALSRHLLEAHPELASQLVLGRKAGFCVIDSVPIVIPGVERGPAEYLSCTSNQGISLSWADQYSKGTSGQWFDVTDVPVGLYVIEVEVNAEHFFHETDYTNNRAVQVVNFAPLVRPPTRTPTTVVPPGFTPSPTATRTPTATGSPQALPTATLAPGTLGGRGFTIGAGSALSWTDGNVEIGYLILRTGGVSPQILPPGGVPLAASTSSYQDPLPATDPAHCYLLIPMGPTGVLGLSDHLCRLPNTASASGAPSQFSLRLNQGNNATLSWAPTPGAEAYIILAVPLNGTPPRFIPVPGFASAAIDATMGVPTCYAAIPVVNGQATGNSELLCGVPGFSTLSP